MFDHSPDGLQWLHSFENEPSSRPCSATHLRSDSMSGEPTLTYLRSVKPPGSFSCVGSLMCRQVAR
jgi:hypothetical protein